MPETIDFDQIARDICVAVVGRPANRPVERNQKLGVSVVTRDLSRLECAGAVDLATMESELTAVVGVMAGRPLIKNLDRALKKSGK